MVCSVANTRCSGKQMQILFMSSVEKNDIVSQAVKLTTMEIDAFEDEWCQRAKDVHL